MAIWLLTGLMLVGAIATSKLGAFYPAVSAWLGLLMALLVARRVGRRLPGASGWLFVLLALCAVTGTAQFLDGALLWWTSWACGFLLGGAAALTVYVGRGRMLLPAVILTLIWLPIQTLLVAAGTDDRVWLLAPSVSILLGWLVALPIRMVVSPDEGALADVDAAIADAEAALSAYDLARARRILQRAADSFPNDLRIKRLHYAAWKFHPFSDRFHQVAANLLGVDDDQLVLHYYKDYLAVTQVRPKLPIDLHLKLARRFAAQGDPDEAARIVVLYLQRDQSLPGLPAALLATVQGYLAVDKPGKAGRHASTLVSMFPNSPEARSAGGILRNLGADRS